MPAAPRFVCHLLNMGRTKYGDCIVVQYRGKTILIDGGHPGDYKDREDRPSIPAQLETIFGHPPPFRFDLMVVTHCHQDHIGCLPTLIAEGIVTCKAALVADEKLGYGLDNDGETDARVADSGPKTRQLVAALSEEDHSSLPDNELADFLADAAKIRDQYDAMLAQLDDEAEVVVRYRNGPDDPAVQSLLSSISPDIHLLGPSQDQLIHCAHTIQQNEGDAADLLASADSTDESVEDIYRSLMRSAADAARPNERKIGWAKNCQSIVLAIGKPNARILLPGDMQFTKPGIPAIDDYVKELREIAKRHGPYIFAKTPHHTSDNGVNGELLAEWGWPPLLGHSGGYNDKGHPDPDSLEELKQLARSHDFSYARTDRNGLISVYPEEGRLERERGRLNNFTPNQASDEAIQPAPILESVATSTAGPSPQSYVDITFVRIPYENGRVTVDGRPIEISGRPGKPATPAPGNADRISEKFGKIKPTPRIEPLSQPGALAGGRTLPPLLFVTDPDRLRANIGSDADRALSIIQAAGHSVVAGDQAQLIDGTRQTLQANNQLRGVVIVGGYDVVRSQRTDVLDADLRNRMGSLVVRDKDGFIVWSDDVYGDKDGDGIAELPVSRIPDARLGSLLLTQLTTRGAAAPGSFGIRNRERPFADEVYRIVAETDQLQISEPQLAASSQASLAAREHVYFMLHGDYRDGGAFLGEDDEGLVRAIDVASLPAADIGVAFAGCCWGALTVSEPAFLSSATPTPRMPERSMALSVLKAGARAFVGATGVHYSPGDQGGFFGEPLHSGFWRQIAAGAPPADALFNARRDYLLDIPHGRTALWNLGVERKIYKQFTCLGLGW